MTGESPSAPPPPAVPQLISLGGTSARGIVDRGPERRVVLLGIVGAAAFVGTAAFVFLTGIGGSGSWLPLHLALAGGGGLAIAALLPHFTVSLAAARPAPGRVRLTGEACIAVGTVAVAVGYPSGPSLVAVLGAGAYLLGIAISAATAFIPARAGLGRRFGVVEAAYMLALANGAAAVGLAMLRVGGAVGPGGAWLGLKPAHAWLNLVGFMSLVVAGTLIHLYPTVVGSRIRSRPALLAVVAGVGLGAPCTALGYAVGWAPLTFAGALGVVGGAAGLIVVAAGAWPGRGRWTTDPGWHRLTIGHLSAAVGWFGVGTLVLAAGVLANGASPAGWSLPRVVGPIVVGWALQALIGSWSHLLPSVGPGDAARHAAQRRELGRLATLRLVAWNIGVGLVTVGAFGPSWLGVAGLTVVGVVQLVSVALLGRALVVRGAEGG
jgi:nitrite reductase (NO-forming)